MATKGAADDKDQNVDQFSEEEQESKALFDQPLILQGKRKRKSVEMFSFSPQEDKPTQTVEYQGGKGTRLGDIPIVEHQITKTKAEDLKVLYKICYDTIANSTKVMIKRNLRSFNGWDFTEDSEHYKKKKMQLERLSVIMLRLLCDSLDLDKSGNKEEIIKCIMSFLMEPKDSGKAPPTPRKRKSSVGDKVKGDKKRGKVSKENDQEETEEMETEENNGEKGEEKEAEKGEDKGEEKVKESEEDSKEVEDKQERDNEGEGVEKGETPQEEEPQQEDVTPSKEE